MMDDSCLFLLFNLIMSEADNKFKHTSNVELRLKPNYRLQNTPRLTLPPCLLVVALPDVTWCGVLINSNNDYDNNKFHLTSVQRSAAARAECTAFPPHHLHLLDRHSTAQHTHNQAESSDNFATATPNHNELGFLKFEWRR